MESYNAEDDQSENNYSWAVHRTPTEDWVLLKNGEEQFRTPQSLIFNSYAYSMFASEENLMTFTRPEGMPLN